MKENQAMLSSVKEYPKAAQINKNQDYRSSQPHRMTMNYKENDYYMNQQNQKIQRRSPYDETLQLQLPVKFNNLNFTQLLEVSKEWHLLKDKFDMFSAAIFGLGNAFRNQLLQAQSIICNLQQERKIEKEKFEQEQKKSTKIFEDLTRQVNTLSSQKQKLINQKDKLNYKITQFTNQIEGLNFQKDQLNQEIRRLIQDEKEWINRIDEISQQREKLINERKTEKRLGAIQVQKKRMQVQSRELQLQRREVQVQRRGFQIQKRGLQIQSRGVQIQRTKMYVQERRGSLQRRRVQVQKIQRNENRIPFNMSISSVKSRQAKKRESINEQRAKKYQELVSKMQQQVHTIIGYIQMKIKVKSINLKDYQEMLAYLQSIYQVLIQKKQEIVNQLQIHPQVGSRSQSQMIEMQ